MKKILQEYFKLKSGLMQGKDGKGRQIIFIDPEVSENTFPLKNDLKNKFKANWIASIKSWGWFVNNNVDEIVEKFAKPCLEFLISKEETPYTDENGNEATRDIEKELQEMLADINEALEIKPATTLDTEAQQQVEDFKKRILAIFNNKNAEGDIVYSEEFLKNLIHFKNERKKHNQYEYKNWVNVFLIMIGGGEEVRARKEWEQMGYEIKENAKPFRLIGKKYQTRPFTKKEKEEYIQWYLKQKEVATVEELPPSSYYDLFTRRLKSGKKTGDSYRPYYFDAFDKRDVIATENAETGPAEPEGDWWWNTSNADEKDKILVSALAQFAQSDECGNLSINIEAQKGSLGGTARGNASDAGHINVVNDGKVRFPTFVHELTHELRHWAFASGNNPRLKRFHATTRNREIMEQEADLCAAFVCEKYDYDIKPHINYVYNWGMSEKNCCDVLDKIAETADFIMNGLEKYIDKGKLKQA